MRDTKGGFVVRDTKGGSGMRDTEDGRGMRDTEVPSARDRSRRGPTARYVGALALIALTAVGCGIVDSGDARAESELTTAREQWARAGVVDYDLAMTRQCFCAFIEPVTVRVRGGVLIEVVTASGDAEMPVPPQIVSVYPTVEGLFALIDEALADEVHEIRVTYHPTLGYPTQLWVDRSPQISDEEFGYEVMLEQIE